MEQQQHPSKRRRLNVEGERQGECIGTDDAINGGNGQRGRTKSKAEKIALEWLRNVSNAHYHFKEPRSFDTCRRLGRSDLFFSIDRSNGN